MAITFDPTQFKIDFPEFANISDAKLTNDFTYGAGNIGQIVSTMFKDDETKYYWLCMVLAHMLSIQQQGLTGIANKAKQGSEEVGFAQSMNKSVDYWGMTPYGWQVWLVIQEYAAGLHPVNTFEPGYTGDAMNIWDYFIP